MLTLASKRKRHRPYIRTSSLNDSIRDLHWLVEWEPPELGSVVVYFNELLPLLKKLKKTKGGRRDKALNKCFLTSKVANGTEHITILGRCEVQWLRIACCLLVPFLVSKVQSSDPG